MVKAENDVSQVSSLSLMILKILVGKYENYVIQVHFHLFFSFTVIFYPFNLSVLDKIMFFRIFFKLLNSRNFYKFLISKHIENFTCTSKYLDQSTCVDFIKTAVLNW